MATSKSRREIFEEQLKDLQKDISNLSSKLSIPPMVTATRLGSNSSIIDSSKVDLSMANDQSNTVLSDSRTSNEKDVYLRQQVEQLSNDLARAYKERDDAKRQVELLTQENEELRKGLPEYARLKTLHDSLKQDHEALKTSLESSERIRLQQKDLIQILQRSSNIAGDSSAASVHSISSISQKGDNSSIHSLTAMTGSQPATNSIFPGMPTSVSADPLPWVYQSSAPTFVASHPEQSQNHFMPKTAMKARRSAGANKDETAVQKNRVLVASNSLTRKKSTANTKQKDIGLFTVSHGKKKKKVFSKKTAPETYQQIAQGISQSGIQNTGSYNDILARNQSLLAAASLQALQNFQMSSNVSPPISYMQQMMQNQSAADHSTSLLAAIQAQHMQLQPSLVSSTPAALPQHPDVSVARANVAAVLATAAGKPPRYPTPSPAAVTGTVIPQQPIIIPTVSSAVKSDSLNHSRTTNNSSFSSSQRPSTSPSTAVRARCPPTSANRRSPSITKKVTSSHNESKVKPKRKSLVESQSAGPTKVLYRPLPSPVSSFGTSKRISFPGIPMFFPQHPGQFQVDEAILLLTYRLCSRPCKHIDNMLELDLLQKEAAEWTDYSDDSIVARKSLLQRLITSLQSGEAAQARLGTPEIVEFITKTLDGAGEDNELIELALDAWISYNRREILAKSTMNRNNCERSESKILSITDTIRHRLRTTTIANRCAALVMILASDSPERQAKLGLVGFGVHMCTILRSPHAADDEVAIMAFRAIRNLAIDDNNCMQIVKKGEVMDIFIPLFQRAIEGSVSKDLLEAALFAVINLSNDTEIAEILGNAGLVTLLAEVFPQVVHDNTLSNAMSCALRNLFSVSSNLSRLEDTKNTSVANCLVSVHENHREDPETMESATWCLANMASNTFFCHYLISEVHIMRVLRATFEYGMYAYPDDPSLGPVAEAIIFVVYFLAYFDKKESSKDRESSAAAASTTESPEEMEQKLNDKRAAVGKIVLQLVEEGAIFVLQTCFTRYAAREAMMEACFRALLALISNEHHQRETILSLLVPIQPVSLVLNAMQAHIAVFDTMHLGLTVLASLVEQPSNSQGHDGAKAMQMNFIAERTVVQKLLSQILGNHLSELELCPLIYTIAVASAVTSASSDSSTQKQDQLSRMQVLVDAGILSMDAEKGSISVVKDLTVVENRESEQESDYKNNDLLLTLLCDVLELNGDVVRSAAESKEAERQQQSQQQFASSPQNMEHFQRMLEMMVRQQLEAGAGEELNDDMDGVTPPVAPAANENDA